LGELATGLQHQFGMSFDSSQPPFTADGRPTGDYDALARAIFDGVMVVLAEKKKACDALAEEHAAVGYPNFAVLERDFQLQILDTQWKDHLHTMDGLREGIGLRGFAQRDPKLEYQREGYALFEDMNQRIDQQIVEVAFRFALPEAVSLNAVAAGPAPRGTPPAPAARPGKGGKAGKAGKIGRNDPCSCGSGKKYKKCCGA
jgi:preprotein translocase subunit SecA